MADYCNYFKCVLILLAALETGVDGILRKPRYPDNVHPLAYSTSIMSGLLQPEHACLALINCGNQPSVVATCSFFPFAHLYIKKVALKLALASAQFQLVLVIPRDQGALPEMIHYWGYPAETHRVTTEDGYILSMHRVPFGRTGPVKPGEKRPALLFGHGLFGSSEFMLNRGGNDSLVFMLADLGFDVWLGNYRGNFYGKKHTSMSSKSSKFWDFSWHQNGVYDQPAMIDYILLKTEQSSLIFVGYSMSSTAQLVLLSERPEYRHRIKANFLMAPSSFMTERQEVVQRVGSLLGPPSVGGVTSQIPLFDLPHPDLCVERSRSSHLRDKVKLRALCKQLITIVAGPTHTVNITNILGILHHFPAGASFGQLLHYTQHFLHTGKFRQYDHGASKNKLLYGTLEPPSYNLSRIPSPVYLYCGRSDYLAPAKGCDILEQELPKVKGVYKVPSAKFNHLDFIAGDDIYELLYKVLISQVLDYK